MFKMYLKYTIFAILSVIMDLVAWIFAPLAALFVYRDRDNREQLYPPFNWLTTHDAPVDSYLFDEYWRKSEFFAKREDNHGTKWMRYLGRVIWIWRNPSYKFDHLLGYDQRQMKLTTHVDNSETWDSGKPSHGYQTAINWRYQPAFLYERQIYYTKRRCIELQFGWKLYRNDEDKVCMLAFRFSPFKKY